MQNTNNIDEINQKTMSAYVHEYSTIVKECLSAQELAALASVAAEIKAARILDIGIGAGRTVGGLRAISQDYTGVDYVQEMVDYCRNRYRGVRFEKADARSLTQFQTGSFDLVFFSCNGISMVDHDGRMAILQEVRRVLAPRGIFIFSTCNRNCPQFKSGFSFPTFQPSKNPARMLVRSLRFVANTVYRAVNRLKHLRHEVHTDHYAIINDVCHHYQTMLYFISTKEQRLQLKTVGFSCDADVYDLSGQRYSGESDDGTTMFVVRNL